MGMPSSLRRATRRPLHVSRIAAKAPQLLLQRSVARFDEIAEHVLRPGREAAGHLAARYQLDPEGGRPRPRLGDAGEPVVIGEGHGAAAGLGRQFHDPPRRVGAVGAARVRVQIDHRSPGA